MITILARFSIEEYERFIGVFSTKGLEKRTEHGCVRSQVFKVPEDSHQVMILLDWESREAFDAFRSDPAARETMKSGGMTSPPEFTILQKAAEYPG